MADGRDQEIRALFDRVAPRYDLMNRFMTFGRDRVWRRFLVDRIDAGEGMSVLDVATGTGDLIEELRRRGVSDVTGLDFSREMLDRARQRFGDPVSLVRGDALKLPFDSATFDRVVSGFLIRNVDDVRRALAEQFRVLRPDGMIGCLDTTPASNRLLRPLVKLHFRVLIPVMALLITGDARPYRYLTRTTEHFKPAGEVAELLRDVGFREVGYRTFMLGSIAVHWGRK